MQLPLPSPRVLHLADQIDQESIKKVSQKIIEINISDSLAEAQYKLYALTYPRPPIQIYIDSYGGDVYQGLGLVGIIEKSTTPVHTYVTGTAMSCAFMIFITGHRRFAYPYATLMYHQVSETVSGSVTDIKQNLEEAERLQTIFEMLVCKRTKIKKEALAKCRATKQDWYMSAEQALKLGAIDAIV